LYTLKVFSTIRNWRANRILACPRFCKASDMLARSGGCDDLCASLWQAKWCAPLTCTCLRLKEAAGATPVYSHGDDVANKISAGHGTVSVARSM
jgi:hypothetical protein